MHFFLIQNFTNYTVASIYQNSFVVNVKWSVKIFLQHIHFYFTIIHIISSLKNTIRIVSSDPLNTLPKLLIPIFKEKPPQKEQEDDEMMEETDKKIKNVRNTCINQVP